ncbi:MAG: phage portal protein [Candidatus Kapaibacterium sp.]
MSLFNIFANKPKPRAKVYYASSPMRTGRVNTIQRTAKPVKGKRAFEAAATTRLNSAFLGTYNSVNFDIKQGLSVIRARSRELAENDPLARKFLNMLSKYVIGPEGFTHRNKAFEFVQGKDGKFVKTPDTRANNMIQEAFWEWSKKKYCTISGDQSLRQLLTTALRTKAVDGEIFFKKVYVDKKENPFGFTLQPIEAAYCDEQLNSTLPNGNYVVMGIEYNSFRKPIAYWFKKITLDMEGQPNISTREYTRILANQIYHVYRKEFTNQLRGFPQFVSVANRLHVLKSYQDNHLNNARSGAMKTLILEPVTPEGDPEITTTNLAGGSEIDENGEVVIAQNLAPGETYVVPQGYKQGMHDPTYPQGEYGAYTASVIMEIASGLDVDYPTLSSNLSNVNYTSTRHGLLDARAGYRTIQSDLREDLLEPFATDWLESAILNGYLNLPMTKFSKFNAPVFIGYRGDWVDPLKDKRAWIEGIQTGLDTYEDYLGEKGKDLDEHLDQLETEKNAFAEKGLQFGNLIVDPNDPATNDVQAAQTKAKRQYDQYDLVETVQELLSGSKNNGNGKH